jgi:hypothetical protein
MGGAALGGIIATGVAGASAVTAPLIPKVVRLGRLFRKENASL